MSDRLFTFIKRLSLKFIIYEINFSELFSVAYLKMFLLTNICDLSSVNDTGNCVVVNNSIVLLTMFL